MTCPRCQENPPQAKFCLECGAPVHVCAAEIITHKSRPRMRACGSSLSEALEQQTTLNGSHPRGLEARQIARDRGFRSAVSVPMLRGSDANGSNCLPPAGRVLGDRDPTPSNVRRPSGHRHRECTAVQGIGDRAIADLTESLEQQTATAEILRVISSSPTDLRPVFATIVRNAVKRCGAAFGGLHRIAGGRITLDAQYGVPADRVGDSPARLLSAPDVSRECQPDVAMLDLRSSHIRDIRERSDISTPHVRTMPNYRRFAVPLLRKAFPSVPSRCAPLGPAVQRNGDQPRPDVRCRMRSSSHRKVAGSKSGPCQRTSSWRCQSATPGSASRQRTKRRCSRSSASWGRRTRRSRVRARADPLPEVHRTPRRADRGQEPGGRRLDVHDHDSGAREERGGQR